jgi:RimJ/RimL family protein N-acetyltransferase
MPHLLEDFEAQTDMWADPEVVRHISGKPSSPTDSWMRLIRYRGLWPMLGFGYWAVREKASGAYVGDIGFADFHRDIQPSIRGIPEAGWILARWAHGRGYATEALRKACSWLDEQTSFEKSVCIVTPGHAASIRVAEKTGYTEPQSATIRGEPCLLLARRRRKEPAPPP